MKKEPDTSPAPDRAEESDEKSPEYLAFESFAKRVLSVPKSELDRREEADRLNSSKG